MNLAAAGLRELGEKKKTKKQASLADKTDHINRTQHLPHREAVFSVCLTQNTHKLEPQQISNNIFYMLYLAVTTDSQNTAAREFIYVVRVIMF